MCSGKISMNGGERKQRHFTTCGILQSFERKTLYIMLSRITFFKHFFTLFL
jgi:hypothetical protein